MPTMLERYLASCCRQALQRERPRIIAVAGSVGKTSTKEAIGVALGARQPRYKLRVTAKNYNNELGVPLTILGCTAPGRSPWAWMRLMTRATCVRWGLLGLGADAYVLEFGTDHPGDLDYLINIASPSIGVLTAIDIEHTEFFGSVAGVAEEESTIVRTLTGQSVAIGNADDPRVMEVFSTLSVPTVTYGFSEHATVRIIGTRMVMEDGRAGLDVSIVTFGSTAHVRLNGIFGRPHAYAIAAALAVVVALDIDFHEAAQLLSTYHGVPGRTRILEGVKHTVLLDDSYNASPPSVVSALRDLSVFPVEQGRRIAALGDMLELGSLSEESHEDVGRAAAEAGIDMLVACGTLAHVIARGARKSGMKDENIVTFATSSEAGVFIQNMLRQGDVVLIKGSQGVRMEKITKELMAHPEHASELLVRQSAEWLAR